MLKIDLRDLLNQKLAEAAAPKRDDKPPARAAPKLVPPVRTLRALRPRRRT